MVRQRSQLRSLVPSVGARLLANCDQSTLTGLRNLAIARVLVRLGLGPVSSLPAPVTTSTRLAEVVVRGYGDDFDVLLVPAVVREILASNLERRGRCAAARSSPTRKPPSEPRP